MSSHVEYLYSRMCSEKSITYDVLCTSDVRMADTYVCRHHDDTILTSCITPSPPSTMQRTLSRMYLGVGWHKDILIRASRLKKVMADKGKKSSMETFAPNDKADYYSGITSIIVNGKNAYELKGKFLDDLHNNAFCGTNMKDVVEHIEYYLKIIDPIKLPNVDHDKLRVVVFPISLAGGALWGYWKMGGDEIKVSDDESSDLEEYWSDKEETVKNLKIETNVFDYETPLCLAFNEFNYLLKVYDKPWLDNGIWNEPKPVKHTCKSFNYKTGCSEWPTYSWREDSYCNGGDLPGAYHIGNSLHYQDLEWYKALEDSELKNEALRNKAIMKGLINDDESSNDCWKRWKIHEIYYHNYDEGDYENETHKERHELCEEYAAVKEDEYDDLTITSEEAGDSKSKSISTTIDKLTVPFPSHLDNHYCEEEEGNYGPKFAEAYGASHINDTIPQKEKDPGSFTLPCYINNVCFDNALVDLGASIGTSVNYPKGLLKCTCKIGKFTFTIELYNFWLCPRNIKVLKSRKTIFVYRRAKIDVYKRKITLRVGEEKIVFTSVKSASSLIKRGYISLDPFLEDYIELNDLNEPFELRRNQGDDLMPTIEEGEVIKEFRTRDEDLDTGIDDYPNDMMLIVMKENGDVIVGEPFLREVRIKARRFDGMITIYNGDDEVTYKWLEVIMEYLVNISKRRAFWSLNEDILKITILKTNTPYPSRKIRRIRACTHQRLQRNKAQYVVSREDQYAVLEIWNEYNILEDIKRGPLLQEISNTPYPTHWIHLTLASPSTHPVTGTGLYMFGLCFLQTGTYLPLDIAELESSMQSLSVFPLSVVSMFVLSLFVLQALRSDFESLSLSYVYAHLADIVSLTIGHTLLHYHESFNHS
ncbi:hypothetical protein Tco_1329620 [Tanacetum coccineum]